MTIATNEIELDELLTPVGLYSAEGGMLQCNLAMSQWCDGSTETIADVLLVSTEAALAKLSKGSFSVFTRQALDGSGRRFAAEFVARRVSTSGGGFVIAVEGRDASRVEQKDMMLKSFTKLIDESNRTLRVRTGELSGLLDGMRQAVFAVDVNLTVVAPVSRHSESVFGIPLAGRSILETLYAQIDPASDAYARIQSVLCTVYGSDELQWDLICDQLPAQVIYHQPAANDQFAVRTLDTAYSPLWNAQGELERIIFAVTDVTEKLALLAEVDRERTQGRMTLERLEELAANDPAAVEVFFSATARSLRRVQELYGGDSSDLESLHEVFRLVHTIKGNARSLGLTGIIEASHRLESAVGLLRVQAQEERGVAVSLSPTRSLLNDLRAALGTYSKPAQQVFRIEDELTADLARELDRHCETAASSMVMLACGRGSADGPLRRALHSAKGVARLLGDSELADAIHAAETHQGQMPASDEAPQMHQPALERLFARSLTHRDQSSASSGGESAEDSLSDLDDWAQLCLKAQTSSLVVDAHRYAGRAEAQGAEWLASGFRLLEALAANGDEPALAMTRRVVSHMLSRWALGLALQAGQSSQAHDEVREQLQCDARLSARVDMASALWGEPREAIVADILVGICAQRWGVDAMAVALQDLPVTEALQMAAGEADDLPGVRSRALLRYVETGFILPSYYARRELVRLFRADAAQRQNSPRSGRRMRKVPEDALVHLETTLTDPNVSTERLLAAGARVLATPADSVIAGVADVVSDLAQSLGKRVNLVVAEQAALFSREQGERLGEALMHMLRNAVDHGIESISEREAAGKNPVGTIKVAFSQSPSTVKVTVEDDGRGIDVTSVIQAAKGIGQVAGPDALTTQEALRLILVPGLTTAKEISHISGRGVGMDVVAANLRRLGGSIDIDSTAGQGSRFTLSLPALVPLH